MSDKIEALEALERSEGRLPLLSGVDAEEARKDFDIIRASLEQKAEPVAGQISLIGKRVVKSGGSFQHSGTVVADFKTTRGERRIVLEFDSPVSGMLHVYRPDQIDYKAGRDV